MIGLGVVSQEEAFYSHEFGVDYNVVFLLIGMMVIINIVRETGLFEVLAIWAAQRADAKPFRLFRYQAIDTDFIPSIWEDNQPASGACSCTRPLRPGRPSSIP